MTLSEQKDHLYTLVLALASGTAGLARYLKDTDLWMAVLVATICGFAGGYAKAAGVALWQVTTNKWEARKARKKNSE